MEWTGSGITSCYDDGSSCGILQDRTQWNNTEYPYITTLKHSDCADFVSQCLCAGNIEPVNGKWERFNDKDNNWAWTYVSGLISYMTDEGYFTSSTFAKAAAGAVLTTSSSHVVLITLNDTVTHRFTGHTNDRNNYQFTNTSGYSYYIIYQTD